MRKCGWVWEGGARVHFRFYLHTICFRAIRSPLIPPPPSPSLPVLPHFSLAWYQ